MSDNELLLALSEMMDKKLKPIQDSITQIKITQENNILPRLQNIPAVTLNYARKNSLTNN